MKREIKKVSKFQETVENSLHFTTRSKEAYKSRKHNRECRMQILGIK